MRVVAHILQHESTHFALGTWTLLESSLVQRKTNVDVLLFLIPNVQQVVS